MHDKALDLRSQRCGRRNQMRLCGLPSQPKAAMRTILAEGTTTMQKIQKALTFAIVCMVGIAAAVLLASMIEFAVPRAEATPAMAKGKPCSTCHTTSKPNKSDVKR